MWCKCSQRFHIQHRLLIHAISVRSVGWNGWTTNRNSSGGLYSYLMMDSLQRSVFLVVNGLEFYDGMLWIWAGALKMARYNMKHCFLISKLTVETDADFPCQSRGPGKVGENFDLNQVTQDFWVMGYFMVVFCEENWESIFVVNIYAEKLVIPPSNSYFSALVYKLFLNQKTVE